MQDRNALYAEPLIFEESWTEPAASLTPESPPSPPKEFSVTYDPKANSYQITKRTIGRIIITNYDPAVLSNEERMRLNDEAEQNLDDELTGGHPPRSCGRRVSPSREVRLRSFYNVISFLGRAMGEEPEYDVPRDPRTPPTSENPVFTLAMTASDSSPPGADRAVKYDGLYYAVHPEAGYQWNRKAFLLLYQLFEMTVVKLPQGAGPTITIAK